MHLIEQWFSVLEHQLIILAKGLGDDLGKQVEVCLADDIIQCVDLNHTSQCGAHVDVAGFQVLDGKQRSGKSLQRIQNLAKVADL